MSCRGSQCSSQILGCYFSYKYRSGSLFSSCKLPWLRSSSFLVTIFPICRCTRDLQIWDSNGLYIGIIKLTGQVCSKRVLCVFIQRDFRSSHSES
ncbi:hypothetical protein CsSME_00047201 [Camellia sinensis var. sinensis]